MGIEIPKFASEAEEADWWYENRERLPVQPARAPDGRLRRGTSMKLAAAAQLGFKLDPELLHKAEDMAVRKGMTLSEFLTSLVVEATKQEVAA